MKVRRVLLDRILSYVHLTGKRRFKAAKFFKPMIGIAEFGR